MSEKLEDYIRSNKKDFDLDTPPKGLWDKIEVELDKKKRKEPVRLSMWISIAASLLIIMGVAVLYNAKQRKSRNDFAELNFAYAQKETRYASLIEEKRDSLQLFAKENPALYRRFNKDLEALNTDYLNLKNELEASPNQTLVIKAMARNLELQLQVINQQLSIINEVKQLKTQSQI
jgi:hypothetical protein